jgi:hypothetical protein
MFGVILEKVTYNEYEAKGGRKLVCARRLKFEEKDSRETRHDAKMSSGFRFGICETLRFFCKADSHTFLNLLQTFRGHC